MKLHLFEASNGGNWGKFAVGRFLHEEYDWRSSVDNEPFVLRLGDDELVIDPAQRSLLNQIGWDARALWVLDLQTREGAAFRPGGFARADLLKHRIWVCPLFEPFLEWLYRQDVSDLDALPRLVELPEAPVHIWGHRRLGRGGNIDIRPAHDSDGQESVRVVGWFGHNDISTGEGTTVAEALRALADTLERPAAPAAGEGDTV